ncbi:uncharacterized protein [Dysidea avara]|uniref:uncharacterized protein n=1 Tax=Dysidea avara TaxID=196820 RepID=UPI00331F725F
MERVIIVTGLIFMVCLVVGQRPRPASCSAGNTCTMQAPYHNVTITTDANYRYITTTQCPPYDNPQWSNPNSACRTEVTYRIPLSPTRPTMADSIPVGEALQRHDDILYLKNDPRPVLGVLGVLLNGVNIYGVGSPCGFGASCPNDGGPSNYVDAVESEGHTVDQCGGHASPNGAYHVHSNLGFNDTDGRQSCQLPVDVAGEHSQLLGWMFDGYGIYGQLSLNGVVPDDLDECGGHTHLLDGAMVYHYHFPYPSQFPWVVGCFRGCPEVSNNPSEFSGVTQYGCTGNSSTNTGGGGNGAGVSVTASVYTVFLGIVIYLLHF